MHFDRIDTFPSSGTGERLRVRTGSGATTVHVARWPRASHRPRIVVLDERVSVAEWSVANDVPEAMSGGFFTKPEGSPLGQVWLDGSQHPFTPFLEPWHDDRAALYVPSSGDDVVIEQRSHLPASPDGSLLQAGPLLVRGSRPVCEAEDPEGFSSTCAEFDSDITAEAHPRTGFGMSAAEYIGVCVDGRADDEAGMLLHEFAELFVELGATAAINLDGGSTSALVTGGIMRNAPRDDDGELLVGGYPTRTLIALDQN